MKKTWLYKLKKSLLKTNICLTNIFNNSLKSNKELIEDIENNLLMSDAGINATEYIIYLLKKEIYNYKSIDSEKIKDILRNLLINLTKPLEKQFVINRPKPIIILTTGINGSGKTTTVGKISRYFKNLNQSILIVAADMFRASAIEQLNELAKYNNIPIITSKIGGNPSSLIFDSIRSAYAKNIDILIIDTAGRLPGQKNLMDELNKIKRVIEKYSNNISKEILLVIDGSTGQNACQQVKKFDNEIKLTGLIITKLDGSAKGGILFAIAKQKSIPVYFIGLGEKPQDIQIFNAEKYINAVLEK